MKRGLAGSIAAFYLLAGLGLLAACTRVRPVLPSASNPFDGRWAGTSNQRFIEIDGTNGRIVFTNGVVLPLKFYYISNNCAVAYETNWPVDYYRMVFPEQIARKVAEIPGRRTWYELFLHPDGTVTGTVHGLWRVQWMKVYLSPEDVEYRLTGLQTNLTHDVFWRRPGGE